MYLVKLCTYNYILRYLQSYVQLHMYSYSYVATCIHNNSVHMFVCILDTVVEDHRMDAQLMTNSSKAASLPRQRSIDWSPVRGT